MLHIFNIQFLSIIGRKVVTKAGISLFSANQPKNSWTLALLTNMMQYPHLCDFVWNHSQIHTILLQELTLVLQTLTRGCVLECQRLNDPDLRDDPNALFWIDIDYNGIALIQLQLVKNLKLLSKDEWYRLIVDSCTLTQWMVFVLEQLMFKVFCQEERKMFGYTVMINFTHLISYAFYYLVKYPKWKQKLLSNSGLHRVKLNEWFKALEKLYLELKSGTQEDMDPVSGYVLCALICLQNDEFVVVKYKEMRRLSEIVFRVKWYETECHNVSCDNRRFNVDKFCLQNDEFVVVKYKEMRRLSEIVFRLKWYETECHNVSCDNRRFNVDKFYKCKQCRVARYCCRSCQKKDWNLNHKYVCNVLMQLQVEYEEKQNELQKLSDKERQRLEMKFVEARDAMHFMKQYGSHEGLYKQQPTLKHLVNNPGEYLLKEPVKCNICAQKGKACNESGCALLLELNP
eukprot:614896_1